MAMRFSISACAVWSQCGFRPGYGAVQNYPEDPAHVMEQFGCRQHHGRITELVEAVEEELGVLVALGSGAGKPLSGLLPILLHIPAQEVQFAQCILCELVSLFGGRSQMLHSLCHILGHRSASEVELSHAVLSKLVPMSAALSSQRTASAVRC